MTKSTTGTKSKDKKAVKVAGSSDVVVKTSTRPKRASAKIREDSEMDLEDLRPTKPQNTKKTNSRMRSLHIGLIRARHAMLVTEDQIDGCQETEEDNLAALRARFAEEEKTFDDKLTEFQAEAASRSDEKGVLDSTPGKSSK